MLTKYLFNFFSVLILSALASGCATLTGTQADCFGRYPKFVDAAACMKAEMPKLKWWSSVPVPALRDYDTYLSTLESKVKRGEMSDDDAKLRMQEYLTLLRASY